MHMKTDCDVIRDLLPLYADDVCSDGSRRMIEEHLLECQDCSAMLEKLRKQEIETGLREEKEQVIEYQSKRFRRRSTTVGSVTSGVFMIPILVCLIVNLTSGAGLGWFWIVLSGLAVAASLIIVPMMVPRDKLFWTFCAFCASVVILLAVCSFQGGQAWFFVAASGFLFGMSVVFLPFVLRARPMKELIGSFSKPLTVIAVDAILFANLMNMTSLFTKNIFKTALMALLCFAGAYLLWSAIKAKRGEEK